MSQPLRTKVKNGLVKKYMGEKKRATEEKLKNKLQEIQEKFEWKQAKSTYKQARNDTISELTDVHVKLWEEENKEKSRVREKNGTNEDVKKVEEEFKEKKAKELEDKFNQTLFKKLNDYIEAAKRLKGKDIKFEQEKKYVLNEAEKRFSKVKNETMDKISKAYQETLKKFDIQKQVDKQMRELSNLPMKIEEKLTQVLDLLDSLLGKLNVDPESPNFDIDLDIVVKQIESSVKAASESIKPLESVGGKIPGLSDINGIVKLLFSQNKPSTPLSMEDIKKLCPKPPSIPPGLEKKVQSLIQDIQQICMMFPMIYINLILKILDVIWNKLNIITRVIPLGSIFPLNLIPAAITSGKNATKLIMTLTGNMHGVVNGIIQKKMQECAALAFPVPNIDTGMLKSMIEDVKENNAVKEVSTEEKKNFSQVSREFFENSAREKGFTEYQIKQIQKNYKAIYDDSNVTIKTFVDDGEQDMSASKGSLVDILKSAAGVVMDGAASVGIGSGSGQENKEKEDKPGYKEGDDIKRISVTPEDYEKFLEDEIKPKMESDKKITYPHLYKTQELMGEYFDPLKSQLADLGNEVVLYDTMDPAVGNLDALANTSLPS